MTHTAEIIDTCPAFQRYWGAFRDAPLDVQIDHWANTYLAAWPELLEKQQADYRTAEMEWKQVARERIFPGLADQMPAIERAHANLMGVIEPVYQRAKNTLLLDTDVVFVVYVGIGCGAGWATTFQGKPAVLFGLEAIAECGWESVEALEGLVAHELGHLCHFDLRRKAGLGTGDGPWWQLYEEGFAQYLEGRILGEESWHMNRSGTDEWLAWCRNNRGKLSKKFLDVAGAGESVSAFFGSWYEIEGRRQTGYYLGREVIDALVRSSSLEKVALLVNHETVCGPVLENWAAEK